MHLDPHTRARAMAAADDASALVVTTAAPPSALQAVQSAPAAARLLAELDAACPLAWATLTHPTSAAVHAVLAVVYRARFGDPIRGPRIVLLHAQAETNAGAIADAVDVLRQMLHNAGIVEPPTVWHAAESGSVLDRAAAMLTDAETYGETGALQGGVTSTFAAAGAAASGAAWHVLHARRPAARGAAA